VPSSGDGDRGVRRRAASVTRTVPSPGANFRTLVMPSTGDVKLRADGEMIA